MILDFFLSSNTHHDIWLSVLFGWVDGWMDGWTFDLLAGIYKWGAYDIRIAFLEKLWIVKH